jgi:aminopeptidase N
LLQNSGLSSPFPNFQLPFRISLVWLLLVVLPAPAKVRQTGAPLPGPGISEELARDRAAAISSLRYDLSFILPEKRSDPVQGAETIRFVLSTARPVILDFDQPSNRILSLTVNGKAQGVTLENGHLVMLASATTSGENSISVDFVAGDEALNRSDDFLYTLFVSARAHLTFPCFDQPDLKARYTLQLEFPASWQVVANGTERESSSKGGNTIVRFQETKPIPTYLFAFAAGRFSVETAQRDGRTFRMFHRETDAKKAARNRDAIFDLHAKALAWLADYTGIPYPWDKLDFVLLPAFQFGGMEHPGAIFYNANGLLLDESATQNQFLARASTISHETAHMWFGDLVTMRWFNDVWMKEVMANFMAAKIVNPSFPNINHELRFLLAHYPAAYSVDRTEGANPIRQKLANLNEAGSLYGAIIYDKAPIVMRQLEMILGPSGFRDGMRDYLQRYSFGNASWPDLIQLLSPRSKQDLPAWSQVWVEERGLPRIRTILRLRPDGKIAGIWLVQDDPLKAHSPPGRVWPQQAHVTIGFANTSKEIPVFLSSRTTRIPAVDGLDRPLYVLPNGTGRAYGSFLLDANTLGYLSKHIEDLPDALTRGAAWIDLWDNLLESRFAPADFLTVTLRALPEETDEQNTQLLLRDLTRAFWLFLPRKERLRRAPEIESVLRQNLAAARSTSLKGAWFAAFRDVVLTPEGLAWLQRIWHREDSVSGLPFSEADEIEIAEQLAVRNMPGSEQILKAQLERTQNPDRKARLAFVIPALSSDPAVRWQSFERFRDVANRRHEPWVAEALSYLNHPLRQPDSDRYILPSLELLPEIERTGDIFFPKRWMDAVLHGHNSPADAKLVRDFLAAHPNLPERLRWVVLSSADDLFRAAH